MRPEANAAHALADRLVRVVKRELAAATGPALTDDVKLEAARVAAEAMLLETRTRETFR